MEDEIEPIEDLLRTMLTLRSQIMELQKTNKRLTLPYRRPYTRDPMLYMYEDRAVDVVANTAERRKKLVAHAVGTISRVPASTITVTLARLLTRKMLLRGQQPSSYNTWLWWYIRLPILPRPTTPLSTIDYGPYIFASKYTSLVYRTGISVPINQRPSYWHCFNTRTIPSSAISWPGQLRSRLHLLSRVMDRPCKLLSH